MLTETERAEIDALVAHLPEPRAATTDALKIVQRHRGWVSDEALADVAARLGMTPAELDSIATFYNRIYRRPVGRRVIHVCDSMSCWLMGGDAVFAELQARLGIRPGETSADGRYTLLPIQCLGACDRAPAMLVDDVLHPVPDASSIDAALAGERRGPP